MSEPKPTATRQFAFLALVKVDKNKIDALKRRLKEINTQTTAVMRGQNSKQDLPFNNLTSVHYARFVLIENKQAGDPFLAFSTDYDGPEGDDKCSEEKAYRMHLKELEKEVGIGLSSVFQYCQGFEETRLAKFLNKHRVYAKTFYCGSQGRSRNQILWEAELRKRIDEILASQDWKGKGPDAIRDEVRMKLASKYKTIPNFPHQPDRKVWAKNLKIKGVLCVVALSAVFILMRSYWKIDISWLSWTLFGLASLSIILVWRFRTLEKTDPQFQPGYSQNTHERFAKVSEGENEFLSNQLTHLVVIKPGLLRWALIRIVFFGLQVLAKNWYNLGKLGGIDSIHFARWSIIPNRGVLFFSNFDSSWQSYLGDFINQASSGLSAVWSNTVGYPRTKWLMKAGSRDATRFLAWTREHQIPSNVWYSAYPGLSITNVNDNTEIHRGVAAGSEMDAATWLFRLRGVDRIGADELYGKEQTRDTYLPLEHIQGIILWGYGHQPEARFLMLKVETKTPSDAVRWLSKLPVTSSSFDYEPTDLHTLNVAFSYSGLLALGIDKELCDSFSTPFVQGSHSEYRARVNGDFGNNAPENWDWGSESKPVHIALLIYAEAKNIQTYLDKYRNESASVGLTEVTVLEGTTLTDRKEHFGFRDGISQPIVKGSGRVEIAGNTVAPGEFLLGHLDGYANLTHTPITASGYNFGLNGSYMVFRQLAQNVEHFWKYCSEQKGTDPTTVASKMIGRWPSGAPLVRHPDKDPHHKHLSDDDGFTYLAPDKDNDRYGARCPFGAHVRRSNPRDWELADSREESLEISLRHRIIRRGRPYGEPLDPKLELETMINKATSGSTASDSKANERGLQFICFNANLERQFEFIQQQWVDNPKFASGSSNSDPMLGQKRAPEIGLDQRAFTVQSDVRTGLTTRYTNLEQFVRVVGSTYFFMPSLPALKLLHEGVRSKSHQKFEKIPDDEQDHIDSLINTLREKMKRDYVGQAIRRDAHPKMHGCVKASFTINDDLPERCRVGLFTNAGHKYETWVRFSNQNGTISSDRDKDIRGIAIKLMGVDGSKLLDSEEGCMNHDFIGISYPAFVTKDVAEFDGLVTALVGGKLKLLRFLLNHLRVAKNLIASLQSYSNPLEITYFSVAPYLFGEEAVKFIIKPSVDTKSKVPSGAGDNYLREAMKTSLNKGPVSFDFWVQFRKPEKIKQLPIEDPGIAWSDKDTELIKVATLSIQQQDFDNPERNEFGEQLSFNPWRCLAEHRPLGGISRARRQVYRALSAFRHDRNATPLVEPKS